MKHLRLIIKGCGNLPHFGSHPGTPILIMFVLLGAIAGKRGGIYGMIGGAGLMLIVFGPMYLYGAYSRAKEAEQIKE